MWCFVGAEVGVMSRVKVLKFSFFFQTKLKWVRNGNILLLSVFFFSGWTNHKFISKREPGWKCWGWEGGSGVVMLALLISRWPRWVTETTRCRAEIGAGRCDGMKLCGVVYRSSPENWWKSAKCATGECARVSRPIRAEAPLAVSIHQDSLNYPANLITALQSHKGPRARARERTR